MDQILTCIEKISQYGLFGDLEIYEKEKILEKALIELYTLSFDTHYHFDDKKYPDFRREGFPDIRKNIESNFPQFRFYKKVLSLQDFESDDIGTGDAVDDLYDIIYDILEIQWRIHHTSRDDALWFFEFIFENHTRGHILDLLCYMKFKD